MSGSTSARPAVVRCSKVSWASDIWLDRTPAILASRRYVDSGNPAVLRGGPGCARGRSGGARRAEPVRRRGRRRPRLGQSGHADEPRPDRRIRLDPHDGAVDVREHEARPADRREAPERDRGRGSPRDPAGRLDLQHELGPGAGRPDPPLGVRAVRAGRRPHAPRRQDVHRRKRAELVVLLAAAVRHARRGHRGDELRGAARRHVRRDQGGAAGRHRRRRRARLDGHRQPEEPPVALPPRLPPRHGDRVPGEPPDAPAHGRLRPAHLRGQLRRCRRACRT